MNSGIKRRSRPFMASAMGGVIGASLLLAGITPAHAAGGTTLPTISLVIDGKGVASDVKSVIQNSRMLVPIRAIAENAGASISYDDRVQRVTVTQGAKKIILYIGKTIGYVNNDKVILDTMPILSGGRTLIPVRFVSQSLGYGVSWDKRAEVAIVQTKRTNKKEAVSSVELLSAAQPVSNLLKATPLLAKDYVFPLSRGSYEPYDDTYGDGRDWVDGHYEKNTRIHEGVDIMARKGTPIYSVSNGTINRLGWNEYGGWRLNVTDESGQYRLYYAHMEAYAPGLALGGYVKAGQLIGFVGNTGYGPVGTDGQFDPHLHFGLYYNDTGKSFDPFAYLQYWEKQSNSIPTQ